MTSLIAAWQLMPQADELGLGDEGDATIADEALREIAAEEHAAQLVEHRTVCLAGLIERFGARYLDRATNELLAAVEELRIAGERRATHVARLAGVLGVRSDASLGELIDAAPAPLASALTARRRALNAAKCRIATLAERNTDLLGRRIAVLAEALSGNPDGLPPLYGRALPNVPRLVQGVL